MAGYNDGRSKLSGSPSNYKYANMNASDYIRMWEQANPAPDGRLGDSTTNAYDKWERDRNYASNEHNRQITANKLSPNYLRALSNASRVSETGRGIASFDEGLFSNEALLGKGQQYMEELGFTSTSDYIEALRERYEDRRKIDTSNKLFAGEQQTVLTKGVRSLVR